jgi:hypothetical protein
MGQSAIVAPAANIAETASDCWLTPQWLVDLVGAFWPRGIDLDPFGHPRSLVRARTVFDIRDGQDAYALPWQGGRIFVNGPYSKNHPQLTAERCALARDDGRELLNLCPAAPGSDYWAPLVWPWVTAVAWLGRLAFTAGSDMFAKDGRLICRAGVTKSGNRTEIAMLYYGPDVDRFRAIFRGAGYVTQAIE